MGKLVRTLIVDDERYARNELKYLLSQYAFINIIDEAASGEEALIKIHQLKPDIVFLDVEMPKMSGIEVAESIYELKKAPFIIFATAYPEFAVDAFRYNAVDYILKPYDDNDLGRAVKRIQTKNDVYPIPKAPKTAGKLAIMVEGEILYLMPFDILYVCRVQKVSQIITKQAIYSVKLTLKELENKLIPYAFFRIHKGYIVNLSFVKRLTPWFNGAYQLELEGNDGLLPVSRNYVKALRHQLEV